MACGGEEVPRELEGFSAIMIDWKGLLCNPIGNLFTALKGEGIKFYLDLPVRASIFVAKYVSAYGGVVCEKTGDIDSWTVVLKHERSYVNNGRPCFMLCYVTDCMVWRELLDINKYLLNKSPSLCGVDLNSVIFSRTEIFTGSLILFHTLQITFEKEERSKPQINDSDTKIITLGPENYEMVDKAIREVLGNIQARDREMSLKQMARNYGGSSFSVRVVIDPQGDSLPETSLPKRNRRERSGERRSPAIDKPARGTTDSFKPLPQNEPVEMIHEKPPSPVETGDKADLPNPDCRNPSDSVVSIDPTEEILAEFENFMRTKSLHIARDTVEYFKKLKLADVVQKQKLLNANLPDKLKNLAPKDVKALRHRVKSMFSAEEPGPSTSAIAPQREETRKPGPSTSAIAPQREETRKPGPSTPAIAPQGEKGKEIILMVCRTPQISIDPNHQWVRVVESDE